MTEKGLIDLVTIVIVTTPAVIAAVSSLRNGKLIKKNGRVGAKKAPKARPDKNSGDWYKPPDV